MATNKYILGFHIGHDPNVGIVDINSDFMYHIESERLSRIKHAGDFYFKEILDKLNIKINDISFVVYGADVHVHPEREDINSYESAKDLIGANFFEEINLINKKLFMFDHYKLSNGLFGKDAYIVRHHMLHAAYTYYTSPFNNSLVFSYDGIGYVDSPALSCIGEGNNLLEPRIYPKFYVGFVYHIITQMIFCLLGNENIRMWEGKTMALSAFGMPIYLELIKEKFYIQGDPLRSVDLLNRYKSRYGLGTTDSHIKPENLKIVEETHQDIYGEPVKLSNENLFEYCCNLASSWQAYFEEIVPEALTMLKDYYNTDNVCISGGSGLNGLINYKLQKVFKNVHVAPATSDCGLGLGAALYGKHVIVNQPKENYGNVSYLGFDFDIDESVFDNPRLHFTKLSYKEIYKLTAQYLSDQKIIGWFQGRAESGPRALGNRSILCDPRDSKMKDVLNGKVKHRESFRPFAPAVLKEKAGEYFEDVNDDKYMLKIANVKEEHLNTFPAAIHIDNTARLQTVSREDNEHFYNLIKAFEKITKLPILLNTSFNDNEEPIVNSPKDAIKTFLNTEIDILIVHSYIIEKTSDRSFIWRK